MRLTVTPCSTWPIEIKLHQVSNILEISFDDGSVFKLPCEYLRVYTPSAEAIGHAPGQEILQVGKEDVSIKEIKPIGIMLSLRNLATVIIAAFTLGICSIS